MCSQHKNLNSYSEGNGVLSRILSKREIYDIYVTDHLSLLVSNSDEVVFVRLLSCCYKSGTIYETTKGNGKQRIASKCWKGSDF